MLFEKRFHFAGRVPEFVLNGFNRLRRLGRVVGGFDHVRPDGNRHDGQVRRPLGEPRRPNWWVQKKPAPVRERAYKEKFSAAA